MVWDKPDSDVVVLFWKDSFYHGGQIGKVFKYFVICFGSPTCLFFVLFSVLGPSS